MILVLYWKWVQNLHLHPRDFHVFLCLKLSCLLFRNLCVILVIMFDKRDKFHSMVPKATPLAKTSLHFYMNPTPQARDLCISISWWLTEHSGRWIYTILCESFTWWPHSVKCLNFSPENELELWQEYWKINLKFKGIYFTSLSRSF